MVTAARDREAMLVLPGQGFVTLSVIDAMGQSARATILAR
jgi:penicillin-binding protein 1C